MASPTHGIELRLSTSARAAPPRASPLPPHLVELRHASPQLRELIVTEDRYVQDLGKMVDCFLKPLREVNGVLSRDDERAIFSNVETLRGVNSELLRLITDKPNGKSLTGVASAFISMAPFFKAYSQYCGDFMGAASRLEQLRQASGHKSALEAILQDGERKAGVALSSLLIKPVQRLCKYPLLFRELLKAVPKHDEAHAELRRSLLAPIRVAQR